MGDIEMARSILAALFFVFMVNGASAQCAIPNNLTNGTNASASQVMANFNAILTCVNSSPVGSAPIRNYIASLTLSTVGSSPTFSVAPGVAADSTNANMMTLSAQISKTTGTWASGSGNGALDAGTIANSTWYHVHLIMNVSTKAVDALISLSATTPTLPSGYTVFRRIGSMKTNSTSQWLAFQQDGDEFQWGAPTLDYNEINNPGTSAVTRTINVPTGVRVLARLVCEVQNNGTANAGAQMLLSDLSIPDNAPTNGNQTSLAYAGSAIIYLGLNGSVAVFTNTSAQIRSRMAYSDGNIYFYLGTLGWRDTRGRDS
jgi:hypothetical protein